MSDIVNEKYLLSRLEALLFIAGSPLTISQIAEVLDVPQGEVDKLIEELESCYSEGRGLALQRHGGRYQLTSHPQFADDIEKFLGIENTSRLTKPSIEALAIIAYRQPITRPGIDAIRGVSSDGVIKSLLSKGLIQEVGRAEGPGRPILFSTTSDFLQHFGLNSINQLPPFEVADDGNGSVKSTILKD
jgi:segregation and condensation protein B